MPGQVCGSVDVVLDGPKVELNVELTEDIRTQSNGPYFHVVIPTPQGLR